jgi:hypothetical protein
MELISILFWKYNMTAANQTALISAIKTYAPQVSYFTQQNSRK